MSEARRGGPQNGDRRPQLQIWDEHGRETAIGTLSEVDTEWEVYVTLEPITGDLFRGRLSFRRGDERYETAPVLVETSARAVLRRAAELPSAMLRQLLVSARG